MTKALRVKKEPLDYSFFSPSGLKRFTNGEKVYADILYGRLKEYIGRFVYFTNPTHLDLIATWIMGTYLFPVFRHYPYLWINADKGSGKTTLFEVIQPLCFNGQMLVSPTPAVLFREVSQNKVTLLIDEVEHLTKRNKDLASGLLEVLNAGYNREGQVKRMEGGKDGRFLTKTYSAYSPKAFSGINDIDEVLRDRTIQVRMLRKGNTTKLERYKLTKELKQVQEKLRDNCYIYALRYAPKIEEIYNSCEIENGHLAHLNNRELDLWEPLMAIQHIINKDDEWSEHDGINALISLSKQSLTDKSEENKSDNETCKTLTGVLEILGDNTLKPSLSEKIGKKTYQIYDAKEVVKTLNDTGLIINQAAFSKQLKRLGIKVEQRRLPKTDQRLTVYYLCLEEIQELAERYNVSVTDDNIDV